MPSDSIRTLLTGLVDYAGLYPPASLDMAPCVENHARYLRGEHPWILGRLICPCSRLEELSGAAAALMPGTYATSGYREMARGEAWQVSAIIDGPLDECLDAIDAFNERHASEDSGLATIDAIEMRAEAPGRIDEAMERIPETLYPFFEVPPVGEVRGFVAAVAGYQDQGPAAAKIRTGGVQPEAIPTIERVARFIHACALAGVPFKATAGLHHPIRSEHALTCEPDSPRAVMHGFLNVFLAAGFARGERLDLSEIVAILGETDASRFTFTDDFVKWEGRILETPALARSRRTFAMSYGSCSFEDPVNDLIGLGLL